MIIVLEIYRQYKRKSNEYIETIGEVVDYNVEDDVEYGRRNITYASIIKYSLNGKKYRLINNISVTFKQKLGKKIRIKYNPDNPVDSILANHFSVLFITLFEISMLII